MNPKIMWIFIMAFCFFITAPEIAKASVVTNEVKSTVDQVVKIVSDKELKKPQNQQKRRSALKKAIGRIFDYREMAKRSMGVKWRSITPAQQNDFVGLFSTLLENSYADKIESYHEEKIVYDRESVEGKYAEVNSRIITLKRDEYGLDYRLLKEGNKWIIYDVVIEGVSLVSNYRTQFIKIINEQGYEELVKKMKTKSEEITAL
ncbi:MAG TPA: ABC transporter substrate-binding protein [Geobacteraceae bacterium]|nr:ABC transporter substrate-binding protein [Geobacteraceae bacterium]